MVSIHRPLGYGPRTLPLCHSAVSNPDGLPHASWVIVVEMFFNFVFILSFGGFDGSPEIVTGLFPIVSVSVFKGRFPH